MSQFECNTCNGTYNDNLPDGPQYYHACPPLTVLGPQPDPDKPGHTPPTFQERPDKRDENVDARDGPNRGKPKSEGKGKKPKP